MENSRLIFDNPFRPRAGHIPPYLAGRTLEQDEMKKLLNQRIILENVIITGLRGVGKTVLLETLKPIAHEKSWLWVGNDLSESASITEENLATRILSDIALTTSFLVINKINNIRIGFNTEETVYEQTLNYHLLKRYFDNTPGLISDKLKATLEFVWSVISKEKLDISGIIFAYDEAQNLADHAKRNEYPLSLLLEVFQSVQRKEIPFMLVLTGLPTLFPKLVESRTYAERMFHIMFLKQLKDEDARKAIVKPIEKIGGCLKFSVNTVKQIIRLSGGYPYFIQFTCKELYDVWGMKSANGEISTIPEEDILRKLDTDFFYGRWARATDKQKDLLMIIAQLENCDDEFTVQELVKKSNEVKKKFSQSRINQLLSSLSDAGLVYKNRHGKYSLAVPLLAKFIQRQFQDTASL